MQDNVSVDSVIVAQANIALDHKGFTLPPPNSKSHPSSSPYLQNPYPIKLHHARSLASRIFPPLVQNAFKVAIVFPQLTFTACLWEPLIMDDPFDKTGRARMTPLVLFGSRQTMDSGLKWSIVAFLQQIRSEIQKLAQESGLGLSLQTRQLVMECPMVIEEQSHSEMLSMTEDGDTNSHTFTIGSLFQAFRASHNSRQVVLICRFIESRQWGTCHQKHRACNPEFSTVVNTSSEAYTPESSRYGDGLNTCDRPESSTAQELNINNNVPNPNMPIISSTTSSSSVTNISLTVSSTPALSSVMIGRLPITRSGSTTDVTTTTASVSHSTPLHSTVPLSSLTASHPDSSSQQRHSKAPSSNLSARRKDNKTASLMKLKSLFFS
ncbi:hypothetical protein L204_105855 [Cryptococcus depauperatus]|nr:hypothetical protein L204_06126 [Cryptococcus depauperatus CBS 7855]